MGDIRSAGTVGASRTPALDALKLPEPAKPGTIAGKVGNAVARARRTLQPRQQQPVSPFAKDFEGALRADLRDNYPKRDRGQIGLLLQSLLGKPLSAARPEDVAEAKDRLNTLSGRVRLLCDAATSGINELVRATDPVSAKEVEAAILLGLNLAFPGSKRNGERLDRITTEATAVENPAFYQVAARDALRRQVQKHVISDAIMKAFPGVGGRREVVGSALDALMEQRLDTGRTNNQQALAAGTMEEGAIRDLEAALEDQDFTRQVRERVQQAVPLSRDVDDLI